METPIGHYVATGGMKNKFRPKDRIHIHCCIYDSKNETGPFWVSACLRGQSQSFTMNFRSLEEFQGLLQKEKVAP